MMTEFGDRGDRRRPSWFEVVLGVAVSIGFTLLTMVPMRVWEWLLSRAR